jgi:putative oxidoreductase
MMIRILFALEMIIVHGVKKLEELPTDVPNPLNIPTDLNYLFAVLGNTLFPTFVLIGFFTRLALLPILSITLTGYFVVHGSDPLMVRDVPFMYSLVGILLLFSGAGKFSIDYWLYKKYWS